MSSPIHPPTSGEDSLPRRTVETGAHSVPDENNVQDSVERLRDDRQRMDPDVSSEPSTDQYQPVSSSREQYFTPTERTVEPVPVEPVHLEPVDSTTTTTTTGSRSYGAVAGDLGVDRESVVAREKEQFGGIKIGSAFFGWVAAAGIAVLITSLLTAAGVVLSLTSKTTSTQITNQAAAGTGTAKTVGLVGAILLLVVLFVAYYCGGYVAGRMARFNGMRQGLAVWLWGIVFAIIIFVLVKVAGSKYNILTNLNLPRIPVDEGSLTATTIIAIAAIVIVTLVGALLGGLAGMRFHRNVDRAGHAV